MSINDTPLAAPSISDRFDKAVLLIAVGLDEKARIADEVEGLYPYSSNFRHGLNIFAALCAECGGDNAKDILTGLCESKFIKDYCTRDVKEWTAKWTPNAQAFVAEGSKFIKCGPIAGLDEGFFALSDEGYDVLSTAERKIIAGKDENQVYEHLKSETQDHYVLGRLFLTRNPLLPYETDARVRTGLYDYSKDPLVQGESDHVASEWMAELINLAYEITPSSAKLCPRCGWTALRPRKDVTCLHASCKTVLRENFDKLEDIPPHARRLRRGVMQYIAEPGKLELLVAEKAQELGLAFKLWPSVNGQPDVCDVLVETRSRSFAIDAKTHRNAQLLCSEIKRDKSGAIRALDADKIIYVIPDEDPWNRPDFITECNKSLASEDWCSVMTWKGLEKLLLKEKGV